MPLPRTPTRHLTNFITENLTPRRCLLAAVLMFILMVALGAIPGKAQELTSVVHDKLLHFLAYGLLSALIYGSLSGEPVERGLRTLIAIGTLGALDEAIQALLPYREASWLDWEVDMIAGLTCVVLLALRHSVYSLFGQRNTVAKVHPDRPE